MYRKPLSMTVFMSLFKGVCTASSEVGVCSVCTIILHTTDISNIYDNLRKMQLFRTAKSHERRDELSIYTACLSCFVKQLPQINQPHQDQSKKFLTSHQESSLRISYGKTGLLNCCCSSLCSCLLSLHSSCSGHYSGM